METNNKYMISEELLAAFEEGKTNAEETLQVLNALANDESLQEEYILSQRLDAMMAEEEEDMEILPVMALAAEREDNLCDFLCEQYILNKRGIPFDSTKLSAEARNNSWLKDKGTPLHNVGRLLEQHKLIVMRQYGAKLEDIVRANRAKYDVVVVVNNNKLTGKKDEEISYHAVVVIKVTNKEVVLYDPAIGEDLTQYAIKTFESAWDDAKSYLVRVKSSNSKYNPQPVDLDDVELNVELIELREAIAENAHEVWADQRQQEGWTYGRKRDDEKKQHPDMVPYSRLKESEKEYDRRMAFDTIKLIKKMGFDIVKRKDSVLHAELMRKINNEEQARVCDCGAYIFMDQIYCSHCGVRLDWKKFK